jgi:tripartite-type tricarboxylate transporter receptor subunit TctC
VTTPKRTPLAPGLPAVSETVPGYQCVSEIGLYALAGTPAPIIHRLSAEVVRILHTPQIKDRLFKMGIDVIGNSSQEYASMVRADAASKKKLLVQIGMLRK